MTDRTIDEQVAVEVMGWVRHERLPSFWVPKPFRATTQALPLCLSVEQWNPSLDVEDTRDMEAEIARRELKREYMDALYIECAGDEQSTTTMWAIITATPLQRCKAALRAVRGEQSPDV